MSGALPSAPSVATAFAAARLLCAPGCFPYHATWRAFRLAGLKGSPAWHTGFYAHALASGPARQPQPRVLVCGSSDETMPRVLATLLSEPIFTVADACPTPLALVDAWAARTGIAVATVRSTAPWLAEVTGPFEVIATDGLLSLLLDPADRTALITRLAALLSDDGMLLYTTRIAGPSGRLEYDRPGRLVQALAAAAWPAPAAERLRLARHRLRQPARPSPFTTPEQVADAFRAAFGQVRPLTRADPPTAALRLHPAFLTRRNSTCVAVAALAPKDRS
ncbi:hypothetical protein ACFV1N_25490 [Streptosporangium canum]|uniref:hypothetical protein n=1 Tax=Streptosporangium canum TaxID=324952 RepID=UPI003688D7BD